jgi:hypothetical protein
MINKEKLMLAGALISLAMDLGKKYTRFSLN